MTTNTYKQNERMDVRKMVIMAMLVAICAVCAQISIPMPFGLVPFTLQTMAVMLVALLLSPKWATCTILVYVLAGAVGLPIFASAKAGVGVFLGPTGGFLWSFAAGVLLISLLKGSGELTWKRAVPACLLGLALIYACGVVQLSAVAGLSLWQSFLTGAAPFLPFECIKIVLAVMVARSAQKRQFVGF